MIKLVVPKLTVKGIKEIEIEISTTSVNKEVEFILTQQEYSTEKAQPFSVLIRAKESEVGVVQGVYLKDTHSLALDKDHKNCRQIIYLNKLYINPEYRNFGIGSAVLECLPEVTEKELGGCIEAVVLAAVPLSDKSQSKLSLNCEFFVKVERLKSFYKKRGFKSLENDFFNMGKK